MKRLVLMALVFCMIGCAAGQSQQRLPSSIIMRNPSTGEQVWLRKPFYYGVGVNAAAANMGASSEYRAAIHAYEKMGFTEWEAVK